MTHATRPPARARARAYRPSLYLLLSYYYGLIYLQALFQQQLFATKKPAPIKRPVLKVFYF